MASIMVVVISRGGGSTRQPQRTDPCQCVSGQPWACHGVLHGQTQSLQCAADMVEPVLGAAAGLGSWFVGVLIFPLPEFFHLKSCCSATTVHRALPVCEWPALGM